MNDLSLVCVKCEKKYPFQLNTFCCEDCNTQNYSNLVFTGGYDLQQYRSQMPFSPSRISYGAQNSPLISSEKLSELFNLPNLLIKDESCLPYGTHKDRRSEVIINVAMEQKVDKIVCLTAGNAGYSLSRYAARAGIDYTSLVFPWVSKERRATLSQWGNVITIDGSRYNGILRPRDFVEIVREYDKYERLSTWKNIWAVTNSFEPISLVAYKELFYEIAHEKPDYVVVPCGSGDILVGLWLGIQELGLKTRIIAVGPKNEHPLREALKKNKDELMVDDYSECSYAEKLTTPFTAVLPILCKIFAEPKNIYLEVDNHELERAYNLLKDVGIRSEYSAVAAFATFIARERPDISQKSKVIIINTGKGLEN
jgi:threonine synthase